MWQPVGPLPAAVYWRRRFLAVAAAASLLALLVWATAALLAPAPRPVATAPAAVAAPALPSPDPSAAEGTGGPTGPGAIGPQVVAPSGAGPSDTGASDTGAPGTATSDTAPPEVAPTGAGTTTGEPPTTTSEIVVPDETPREPVPVPPSVPAPPTGPVPCTNDMLTVSAEVDAPEHRVGQRPTLRLVVVNVSDQPCVRDLDGARQEIVVWSGDGADRLWSSNDCVNPETVDLRTLVPGQPVAFAVRWAGRTSVPGCAEARTVVPPGAYRVMTRIDDLISAPTPFLRSPAT